MKIPTRCYPFRHCLLLMVTFYIYSSTLAEPCYNLLDLDECIDGIVYRDIWDLTTKKKCGAQSGKLMHCQKLENGNICSVCVTPKTCDPGTYARIDTLSETVSCVRCKQGWFQENSKESFRFTISDCDEKHNDCSDTQTLCFNGTRIQDNECQCNHEAGYKPVHGGCECFDYHSTCGCIDANCPEGGKLDSNYQCIPVTTARMVTTIITSTAAPRIGSVGDESESDVGIIVGSVFGVLGFVLVVIVVGVWCYRKRRSKNGGGVCCIRKHRNKNGIRVWCLRNHRNKNEKHQIVCYQDSNIIENGSSPISGNGSVPSNSSNGITENDKLLQGTTGDASAEMETVIATASHDPTAVIALNQSNGELVRETAKQAVTQQNLRDQVANRPTNQTYQIKGGTVNIVSGANGKIEQVTNYNSGTTSSQDEDSGDENISRGNVHLPPINLKEDGGQSITNQREGGQTAMVSLREDGNGGTDDLEQTFRKTVV